MSKIYGFGFGVLLIPFCTLLILLHSTNTYADNTDVVDNIGIEIPTSCTMTGTGMNTHTASIPNGTSNSSIGETNVSAFCNDSGGFAIYAVGYTDDEYGKNVLSNSTLGSDYDISTGLLTSGQDSQWAMKLSTITNPTPTYPLSIQNSFDSFHTIPTTYTMVAKRNESTDSGTNAIGSSFKTTYQAYISNEQPSGLYKGQVKYVLVHPNDHATPDEFYGKTMQTVSEWGHKVALGQTVTVMDERDGQEYTVARLADGKLWMTKNLRLDLSKANITADNTNNPTQAFLTALSSHPESSTYWCYEASTSACIDQIHYNTDNLGDNTISSDGHTYDEYGVYYNFYAATAGNGSTVLTTGDAAGDICPSNWHLPTRTPTNGAPSTWTGDYWELASILGGGIASDNSNYSDIVGQNGLTRMLASPNNFLQSGYFSPAGLSNQGTITGLGSNGGYWTSSKNGAGGAFASLLQPDAILPGYYNSPTYNGYSVRCVADPVSVFPLTVTYGDHVASILVDGVVVNDGSSVYLTERTTHTIMATFDSGYVLDEWGSTISSIDGVSEGNVVFTMTYKPESVSVSATQGRIMQEVASWGSNVLEGQTVTASDARDNSIYTIARLADGKLWMTKNLRLDFQKSKITAENTHGPTSAFIEEASTRPEPSNTDWCSSYGYDCNNHIQYSTISIGNNTVDSLGHTYDEYGVYYNWYTATGGNGTNTTLASTTVYGDICPAGWFLPTRTDSSDLNGNYYELAMATKGTGYYNDSANVGRFLSTPINMVYSGSIQYYNGIEAVSRGSTGAYWISMKYSTSNARYWMISSSNMHDYNYGNGSVNYGNTIRCLSNE